MKQIFFNIICFLMLSTNLALAQEKIYKLDDIVITASRYEEPVSTVPANVTIISDEDIKNSTAQDIPELLSNSGFHISDITGNRRSFTVDIRGFGETSPLNTLVLIDGRKVNSPDLSGVDWNQIPKDAIKRIEIIRGSSGSIIYGDNATGGVINIITKEGDKLLKGGSEFIAGSYKTFKNNTFISGNVKDISFYLTGNIWTSEGYRDNSKSEIKDLDANIGYIIKDFMKLNLTTGYHFDNTRLPGALLQSDLNKDVSRTSTTHPNDFAKTEDYYFKIQPEVYFHKNNIFKIDISFRKRDARFLWVSEWGESNWNSLISTLSASPQIVFNNKIFTMDNTFTLGLDYQKSEDKITSTTKYDLKKENYGGYAHNEIKFSDKIAFATGYRYDKSDFKFSPATNSSATAKENVYTTGLNYNVYKKSYLYLNYAKGFRYPVFDELYNYYTNTINANLTNQTSDNYETGGRYYFTDNCYTHLNLFRIDTKKEIFFNPTTSANENLDGKTQRQGVEISLQAKPTEQLTLKSGYTYINALITEGTFKDKKVPGVPTHKVNAETIYDIIKGLSVSLNSIYIGNRYFISDFSNTLDKQDSYLIFNSRVQYQWKNLKTFLTVNNLTNKKYSEYGVKNSTGKKAYYPSPERNFLLGMSVNF